jgi:hypothetical protein
VTTSTIHSAYPAPIDDLLPKARALAAELGEIPSRNRLKKELKVGAPKANALRDALTTDTLASSPTRVDEAPEPTETTPEPIVTAAPEPVLTPVTPDSAAEVSSLEGTSVDPGTNIADTATTARPARRGVRSWPVLLLAAPAFVAIWSGWVGLGGLTGFGVVHPLPGIWDSLALNTAITLPIGVETYAAFALRAWLSGNLPAGARRFAKWSAIGSLLLGALGQVAYHLMEAAGVTAAPWPITTLVACLPVAVLGMGAALAHLIRSHDTDDV